MDEIDEVLDQKKSNSNNTNLMIIGIVSSIIGGLIVYYLLKSKSQTNTLHPSQYLLAQAKYNEILEDKLVNIESQLGEMKKLSFDLTQTQTKTLQNIIQTPVQPQIQYLQVPTQQNNQQQPIINTPIENTLYKNNESWEIFRGKDGFISKLNVLRDVKTNK